MLTQKMSIKGGGSYSLLPEGAYTCQIVDVNTVTGFNQFKGLEEEKLKYMFAVLDELKDDDGGSTRDRYLWKKCGMSLNEKSWLFKLAKATLGRDLTTEELAGFDPESLVGKQVKCLIDQKPAKDGTVWNNIISFSKADKKLEPVEYVAKPTVVEKSSSPIELPKSDQDTVDEFLTGLELDKHK